MNKDRLTKQRRSWNMSRIRGKNTTPEMRVRSLLHRLGYRFRLHVRVPITAKYANYAKPVGRERSQSAQRFPLSSSNEEALPSPHPMGRGAGGEVVRSRVERAVSVDILLPQHKTAIFVHGCFWHRHKGCKNCTTPTNRRAWWLKKLEGNAARDQLHQRALRRLGWRTLVLWECETEKPNQLERIIRRLVQRPDVVPGV